jgi:hypothetical protein
MLTDRTTTDLTLSFDRKVKYIRAKPIYYKMSRDWNIVLFQVGMYLSQEDKNNSVYTLYFITKFKSQKFSLSLYITQPLNSTNFHCSVFPFPQYLEFTFVNSQLQYE